MGEGQKALGLLVENWALALAIVVMIAVVVYLVWVATL